MIDSRFYLRTAVLLAFSSATAFAQQATLSNLDFSPCCIAPDGHGNNFTIGFTSQPPTISVTKLDATGTVLSSFPFHVGSFVSVGTAAVDPQGNLWIVGWTLVGSSSNSLVLGLIAKLDSTGANLLYTSEFGGLDTKGYTRINAIAFAPDGSLYIGGSTSQTDFPVTPGAFTGHPSPATPPAGYAWTGVPQYGFIAKLTQSNQTNQPYTIPYATLIGGGQIAPLPPCPVTPPTCTAWPPATTVSALAVDANGVVTAAGTTQAVDFPATKGAFQTQYAGNEFDVNAFIARLNAQGTGLIWSTLLGVPSSGFDAMTLSGMAVDSSGNIVVTGTSDAPSMPVTAGALQPHFANPQRNTLGPLNGFVAKVDSTGSNLLFSTYYGIENYLSPPRLDAQGNIWITASVLDRSGLALHANSLVLGGSLIAELAPDGSSVLFSELLPNGVAGQDLALNPDGSLIVAGRAQAAGVNLANGFELRLPRSTPTGVSVLGVADSAVNAATGTVAPGEFVSVYGTGLGPAGGVGLQLDPSGSVTKYLGGVQVSFDGIPAPIIYASDSQINALVPYEIAGSQQVTMRISTATGSSQTGPLKVVPAQPNVFAVLNSDGTVNSSSNLAPQGSLISILVSGPGALNATLPDGAIASSSAPSPILPVQVSFRYSLPSIFVPIGGQQTLTPSYAAGIPGAVINLLRVDTTVPAGCKGDCTISVQVGSSNSPTFPLYGQ